MRQLNQIALMIISALILGACSPSKESLCTEHARLTKRFSELVILAVANPQNFDKTEFDKVTEELTSVKGKLESIGSSGKACP